MSIPYLFAGTSGSNPLANLDANFAYTQQKPLQSLAGVFSSGAYQITPVPAITSYQDGQMFMVSFSPANTTAGVLINISGLGNVGLAQNDNGDDVRPYGVGYGEAAYLIYRSFGTWVLGPQIKSNPRFTPMNSGTVASYLVDAGEEFMEYYAAQTPDYPNRMFFTSSNSLGPDYQVAAGAGTITYARLEMDGSSNITLTSRVLTVASGATGASTNHNFQLFKLG